MRGEWEVEVLALEVVLTCTEMLSPCQVAGREEPRRRPHLPGRKDRVHDGRRRARPERRPRPYPKLGWAGVSADGFHTPPPWEVVGDCCHVSWQSVVK